MTTVTPDQAYGKACACYVAGDLEKAEKICHSILGAAPDYVDAAYLLAIIANRRGRHDEGDRLLQRAIEHRGFSIRLDGSAPTSPRHGTTPHVGLQALLLRDAGRYIELLRSFTRWLPQLQEITPAAAASDAPHWNNPWIPPLDGIALYAITAQKRPRRYIEVGSGNSTKFVRRAMAALRQPRRYLEVGSGNSTRFVRRAITDHKLATSIISIDPQPRAAIDSLCDVVIRKPLEETDLAAFSDLGAGDLVFIDSSHRCLMNSDVTVFFTEILPSLAPGVTVGIHDIFLPYDYPAEWVARYYSEQYLLACYLLSRSPRFNTILPCHFLSQHPAAQDALLALRGGLPDAAPMEGGSFWLELNSV